MTNRKRNKHKARIDKLRQQAIKQSNEAVKNQKQRIADKSDLENNTNFDLELLFNRKSKNYPRRQAEMNALVDALSIKPCPPKCRPPIASGKKRETQSCRNLEALLANVYDMLAKGKKSIAVSLSPNSYAHRKVSSGIINLFKLAHAFGYVELRPGYYSAKNRRQSFTARIVPLPKLFDLLSKNINIKKVVTHEADSEMELRTTIKTPITYTKHGRTFTRIKKSKLFCPQGKWSKDMTPAEYDEKLQIRNAIQWFNLVFSDYNMKYQDEKGKWHKLNIKLRAIYSDTFDRGGRLYDRRDGIQTKSKQERATTRINNQPTKELDFGGLHPRLLYHLSGADFPLNKDPYVVVLEAMNLAPKTMIAQFGQAFYDSIRNDMKVLLLALVNGEVQAKQPLREVVKRANWRLFRAYEAKKKPDVRAELQMECNDRKQRWKQAGLLNRNGSCLEVIKAFQTAHQPIAHYFSSGHGIHLQNIDSTIAIAVLSEMMFRDKAVPTLPVHDSFITLNQPKYLRQLENAMKDCYKGIMQQITGVKRNYKIPVKGL